MSTSSGSAAGVPSGMTRASAVAREHHWFPEPTQKAPMRYIVGLIIAQFVFFVALLGPAIIGVGIKVISIIPAEGTERETATAIIAGLGAAGALVGNVVFGRLSDRTTARWGRRRPWIVSGTVVMTIGFLVMALGPDVPVVAIGWLIAQLGANATLAPFIATISDQVPKFQRASVSALLGIAQNVGILGGTYVAELFQDQMLIMFVGPSILAIVAMAVFAFVLPDQVLPTRPPRMNLREWAQTFWVSPRRHPDYALAWWSRFLITLATFMFTTFRIFYVNRQLGVPEEQAASVITTSVLIYTVALVLTGWVAGKISDRTGLRKIFVGGSTALFAVGTILLAHAQDVQMFYIVEAILGVAYGVYIGVDLALVVDVLPNPDDAGKDLGVFNMANAMPQTIAPILGGVLVGIGAAETPNYPLLLWSAGILALVGALVIIPIKKVR
ncbi:MFS transporter [Microbacterium sp. JZ37]|uniref:MFS transporter n=1 Tax=Microbacterium sp. JZ37 TaxID=2654193 RepID=UPI002B4676E6|nr:MFS transporter [Microbacterium sp. JZ37]WRH17003.1 MFS transporter [Microbacterium sp. JZ37]